MELAERQQEDDPWSTFPSLWREAVALDPGKTALVCDDARLTFAELDNRSRLLARGLAAAGCTKGSRVAILHPNGPEALASLIAVMRMGAVAMPLSTLSTATELGWLLRNSDAQFVLSARAFRSQDFVALLGDALEGIDFSSAPPLQAGSTPWLRHIWFSGDGEASHHAGWDVAALEAGASITPEPLLSAMEDSVRPADRVLIAHTSGSTSMPKGVIHDHGPLFHHLQNINELRKFGSDEILFSTSPWFWIAGLAYGLLTTVISGATIVISNETDGGKVLDVAERERPTITNGHYSTVVRLAEDPSFTARDLTSIRRGNLHPISPPAIRPAEYELRHNIYGMTEVGGALTMNPDDSDQPEHRRGSCGNFLPGYEWRIVDPDTGNDVLVGEVGELWIRSPLMMEGYYGKLRSEVFTPDGWWRSADLGRVDNDGLFYPVSRLNDMIKTSGANVAPSEVASVLRKLTGRECLVLGLPDERRGQIVAALVLGDEAIDEAELQEKAGITLSRYKVPRLIRAMPSSELPMLSSGKIDLRGLQDRLLQTARTADD